MVMETSSKTLKLDLKNGKFGEGSIEFNFHLDPSEAQHLQT